MSAPRALLVLLAGLVSIPSLIAAPPARTDRFGDPLPEGAVARLGTLRLHHQTQAHAVAFSPDGKLLASGDGEGILRLWDAATGREVRCLLGHAKQIAALAFSPNGKMLAAEGARNSVILWDPATGKEIARFGKRGMQGAITSLAFLPAGDALVVCRDGHIFLWSVADGRELLAPIDGLHFAVAPNGLTLAVAGAPGIRVIEISTGRVLRTFDVPPSAVRIEWSKEGKPEVAFGPGLVSFHSPAFSPDGKILAALDDGGGVWSWDTVSGDNRPPLPEKGLVHGLAFAPNGKTIVLARGANDLVLYDLRSGKARWSKSSADHVPLEAVAFAPDSRRLATAGVDGRVHLWDVASGRETDLGCLPSGEIQATLSPDGTVLATFGYAWYGVSALHLHALADNKPLRNGRIESLRPNGITFTPSGNLVVSIWDERDGYRIVTLDAATAKEIRRFKDGTKAADWSRLLLVAPDGKTVAGADERDYSVVLSDLPTGRERLRLTGHTSMVRCGAFSPDGKLLVTAGWDATVRAWGLATGQELRRLDGHGSYQVTAVAFAPDGSVLATAGEDGFIALWDGHSGELRRRIPNPASRERASLAFSPDSKLLAATAEGDTFAIWEVGSGKLRSRTAAHEGGVNFVAFTPDGSRLVSVGQDGTGLVWNVSELKVPAPPPAKAARLDALGDPLPDGVTARLGSERWRTDSRIRQSRLSPDGKIMAAVCAETVDVRAWSAMTGKELWRRQLGLVTTELLAFTSDGKLILAGEGAGLAILKADSGEVIRRFQGGGRCFSALALSPDDRLIATAEDGGPEQSLCLVRLWDLSAGRPLRTFLGQRSLVFSLAFSADGRRLLSSSPELRQREDGDGGGAVIVWDIATGKQLYHLPARDNVVFSPDGRLLAYRLDASTICVDDLERGERCRIPCNEETIWIFAPDSKRLATGDHKGPLRLWDTATGKEVRVLRGLGRSGGLPMGFSADGQRLLTRDNGHLRLWDMVRGEEIHPFPGHRRTITSLAYSPDGRTLLTGSHDQTVRLWDVRSGKELMVLPFRESDVSAVAFAPDGKTAAAAGQDGTVRLFDVATGKALHTFPARDGSEASSRFLAFSADGRLLTDCGHESGIVVWDVAARKALHREKLPDEERVIGLSRDGTLVLSSLRERENQEGARPRLCLRRALTGREVISIVGEAGEMVNQVAFSPDNKMFAVGRYLWDYSVKDRSRSFDLKVRLFETATGKEIGTLAREIWADSVAFRQMADLWRPSSTAAGNDFVGGDGVTVSDIATGAERGRFSTELGIIDTAIFSPDGVRTLAAVKGNTVLLCDMSAWPPLRRPAPKLTATALDRLCDDLAASDAATALQAVQQMAGDPERAVPRLRERLPPVAPVPAQRLAALIPALELDAFSDREQARKELEGMAELAAPTLRKTLMGKPSAELRRQAAELLAKTATDAGAPERLQAIRATALLEQIDTAAARALLSEWSQGAPEARLTQEAKAALRRLTRQVAVKP